MSGSGGYYKYRCKYWLTYNCPHWVWVNKSPCAHCLADGRDANDSQQLPEYYRLLNELLNTSVHIVLALQVCGLHNNEINITATPRRIGLFRREEEEEEEGEEDGDDENDGKKEEMKKWHPFG